MTDPLANVIAQQRLESISRERKAALHTIAMGGMGVATELEAQRIATAWRFLLQHGVKS